MTGWITSPLAAVSIGCALIAALLLGWFLWHRPPLVRRTKLVLLLAFGVFPIASAATGNVVAIEQSKTRRFCGSCHVMVPWTRDAANPRSTSLASQHGRNALFGEEPCYACHADYGMFQTIKAKSAGLGHVWAYVTEYHSVPVDEALRRIEMHRPYPNANCIQCHSTRLPGWLEVQDHRGMLGDLRSGRVSCASRGCHGPAHPFGRGAEAP